MIERFEVVDDPAAEVADLLVDIACAGGHIALAGGSTPRRAYELAAESDADLSAATMWLGDERVVPPDDERSNARMVREALIDRLPEERRPRLMPVDTRAGPDAAAAAYEALLRETLGNHPRLDLALLGLGPGRATRRRCSPASPRCRRPSASSSACPRPGMEPQRAARDADAAAAQRRARGRVPRRRRRQGAPRSGARSATPPDESAPAAHVRPGAGTLTGRARRGRGGGARR